jgi:hypothetical protein
MKTPMQELIEWLNDYPTNVPTIHKSAVISKAESLLEKEKEQMLKTFTESRFISRECAVWNCEGDRRKWESFEHYYNETFNTNQENLQDSTNGYTYYPQENKTVFNTKEK